MTPKLLPSDHGALTPGNERLPSGVLLFGPPGCGKGTVGKQIEKLPGFVHCSSGDLIRSALTEMEAQGECWSAVSTGALIDDGILWRLFDAFLSSLEKPDGADGPLPLIIVDGIPRCRSQVRELAMRIDVRGVLYLECTDPRILRNRLKSRSLKEARADDASCITLDNRLRLFQQETLPLLDGYQSDIVHRFDASQTHAKVLSDILAALHLIQRRVVTQMYSRQGMASKRVH